jgi:hypothetical protein
VSGASEGPARLHIALFSDTHIEPEGDPEPRSNRRAAAIVERINGDGFELALHLGDVVHPLPSMASAEAAWQAADAILGRLRMPLAVIPGNHDIGDKSLPWLPAKSVRADWVESFEARFGPACRAIDHGPVRLVLLNAPLLNSGLDGEVGQWRQLEELLAEPGERRLFAFLHYPPFLVAADEPSTYDNLDEPGRARLLALLADHGCEALFCGHVHHRFLDHYAGTAIYTVPATGFTRRDYVETHPLAPTPEQEHGRNLTTKLGFLELAIHEHGHRTRFHRLENDFGPPAGHALGVDLRHPWSEVRALPYNPPTDAFQRRRVRDDGAVLALLDLGIRRARVPLDDFLDPVVRGRMAFLAEQHGVRWTVFALGPLAPDVAGQLAENASMIEAVEVIGESGAEMSGLPVVAAPLITAHAAVGDATNLGQFTGWGLTLEALRALPPDLAPGISGYVLDLPWRQPFAETCEAAAALAGERGWRLHVTVGLMGSRPDLANTDDQAIVRRVRGAAAFAARNTAHRCFLDTFESIDRGYFVRHGLIDRRGDPTPAGLALARFGKEDQP